MSLVKLDDGVARRLLERRNGCQQTRRGMIAVDDALEHLLREEPGVRPRLHQRDARPLFEARHFLLGKRRMKHDIRRHLDERWKMLAEAAAGDCGLSR